MIGWTRCMLAAIRPSSLVVRLPKVGVLDDSRNVDKSLKSLHKELGIHKTRKKENTAHDRDLSIQIEDRVQSAKVNLKNRLHRSIWLAMKRRDRPQFEEIEKQLRSSQLEMDGVTYTLLIHGHLLFSGLTKECIDILQEMKEHAVHPSLIRFNARIMATCGEMANLNAKPLAANIVQITRASWLTAVLITRRYPQTIDIAQKEAKAEKIQNYIEAL